MILGQQLKTSESLNTEYKEFCIKTNVFNYFTICDIKYIIKTGLLNTDFNNIIDDNLQKYFDVYVPKYASAFYNSNIHNGTIKIGVNDYNEITGIPYIGNISHSHVQQMVKSSLQYISSDVSSNINVNIHPLKIQKELLNDISDLLVDKMKSQRNTFNILQQDYYKKRKIWINEVYKFSVKLSDIIRKPHTQQMFFNWLKSEHCLIRDKCHSVNPDDIDKMKHKRQYIHDTNHVIYWIVKFKDEMMTKVQLKKPDAPTNQKIFNGYVYLITHLSDLRKKFVDNNTNINFYMISITFYGQFTTGVYYNKINSKIYKSYRFQNDTGPYCESFEI